MHPLRRRLSSLNHLFAVEAVGRHLSFTAAADELGISQPAVSKAIRVTEEAVGFRIFARQHRGLALTAKGARLFQQTQAFLHQMAETLAELPPEGRRSVVRASFSSSFVALWMLPRLPAFSRAYPDIALHLEESDSDMLDLVSKGLDFSARLGNGTWSDLRCTLLVPERVGAVASPAYLERNPGLSAPRTLLGADLVHVHEPKRARIGWRDWLARFAVASPMPEARFTVSDYHSAIDAALLGQGVALGWEHLVRGSIEENRLVWLSDHRVETGMNIYLVERPDTAGARHIEAFRSWIVSQFSGQGGATGSGPAALSP